MIPLRSRRRLKITGNNTLLLRSDFVRRITFGIIFLILSAGMVLSFDPSKDLTGARLGGTIFYLVLIIIALFVTALEKLITFDKNRGVIVFCYRIFMMDTGIKRDEISIDSLKTVILSTLILLKREGSGIRKGSRLSNYMQNRTVMVRLFLETEERKILIADGSYKDEIEEMGRSIARFLGKSFQKIDG